MTTISFSKINNGYDSIFNSSDVENVLLPFDGFRKAFIGVNKKIPILICDHLTSPLDLPSGYMIDDNDDYFVIAQGQENGTTIMGAFALTNAGSGYKKSHSRSKISFL